MNPRIEKLRETLTRRPLLGDGATGTQLQQLGLAPGACGELWNLEHPEKVLAVHQAYRDAGSDLLTTNTFGGTSYVLNDHGAGSRVAEINQAGARLAREVAGDEAWVLGDIGPFGGMFEPYGEALPDEVSVAFQHQAKSLLEGGADAILIETMSDIAEAELAIKAVRKAGAEFVIATYAFQQSSVGFRTMMGTTVAEAIAAISAAGADVVGANCGTELSLANYVELTSELVAASAGRPVIVQPNAGSPRLVDGNIYYDESPAEFAATLPHLKTAGASIIGGCCGSTPEHIAAMNAHIPR